MSVSMENFGQLTLFDTDIDVRAVPSEDLVVAGEKFAARLEAEGFDDHSCQVYEMVLDLTRSSK